VLFEHTRDLHKTFEHGELHGFAFVF